MIKCHSLLGSPRCHLRMTLGQQVLSAKTLSTFLASQCPYSSSGNTKRIIVWRHRTQNFISLNYHSLELTASLENCGSADHLKLQPDGHGRAARATQSSPVLGEQKLVHQRSSQAEALNGTVPSFHSYPGVFITWPCTCLLTASTAFQSFPSLPCSMGAVQACAPQLRFSVGHCRYRRWRRSTPGFKLAAGKHHNLPPAPTTQVPEQAPDLTQDSICPTATQVPFNASKSQWIG